MRLTFLLCTVFFCLSSTAGQSPYPALRDSREADLQRALDAAIENLGLQQATREKRLAVTIVDLRDPRHPRMAGVNGNEMFYSASLPKIAILFAAFQRIEDGELQLSPALRKDLVSMIRRSSNTAATRVLDLVGRDYLTALLMSDRYALYDEERGGGLWVGKPYGPGAAYQRDPLKQISHGATTIQAARFYYLLETGRLVSAPASREMKQVLSSPAIRHKFVKGLTQKHPDALIFRKSGTWRDFHSDSAIVQHDGKHYIVVALSHDARGANWLEKLVVKVDELMPTAVVNAPRAAPR